MRRNSLRVKRRTLKRASKNTARHLGSFIPGIGLALSVNDTVKSARKTARAAKDYGNALYKEARRRVKRYNPL